MEYRKVTQAELEDYIKRNPGGSYMVDGREFQAPFGDEDQGWFMRLLTNLTKPLRTIPGGAWSAITGSAEDNPFLTTREEQAFKRDPTGFGTKSAVALGSYLIPGGGGAATTALGRMGTAAVRGAGAGALSGYGYSEEGEELESALRGGALGGVLGGVLQGIGEGAQAWSRRDISKVSDQEVKNWIGEGQLDKVGGSKRAKEGISIIKGEAQELGLPTLDRLQREGAIDPVVSSLDGKADSLLGSHEPISKTQITKEITDKVKNIKGYKNNSAFVEVKNILKGYDKTLTGPEVRALYKEIAEAGSVYSISPTARASTQRIWKAAREGVRGTLTGEGSEVVKQLASVYSVKDSILRQAGRDVGVSAAGGVGVQFKPRITTKIADRASSMATNLPQTEGLTGLLQQAPALQRGIPAISSLFGSTQPTEIEGATDFYDVPSAGEPTQGYELDKMALVEAVLSGQLSTAEANWLMGILAPEVAGSEIPTTESGRKFWFAAESAKNVLNMLEQVGTLAGPFQGIRTGLTSAVGIADEHTALKNEIESMRSIVFNALGGAQLTPNEQRQYEKFIPKVTDTKAQVRQKLQTLIPKLQGLMGAGSTQDSGSALYEMLGL